MAAPTPINNVNINTFQQQLTTVVVDTWTDLIKPNLGGNSVFNFTMHNIGANDLVFGLRITSDISPTSETILIYNAKLPGTTTLTDLESNKGAIADGTNKVCFSIPMNVNIGPTRKKSEYFNGLNSFYQYNSDGIMNFDGRSKLQIYVSTGTTGFIASAVLSYSEDTAEKITSTR